MGFSRQEYWSWLPFLSPAGKSLQLCPTLWDPIDGSPPGYPITGILQARTLEEMGCHFLLQYMKVKSESEGAQSCPTLSDPMDCSLPGSSIHGIFQARVLEWGAIAFSNSFLQWTAFSQNSPPWPIYLGWPYMGIAHGFIESDKAVVHVIRLVSFLWLWFSFWLPSVGEG